jgi:hypothetical protein
VSVFFFFMYLRQNSQRYSLAHFANSSGYGEKYHVSISYCHRRSQNDDHTIKARTYFAKFDGVDVSDFCDFFVLLFGSRFGFLTYSSVLDKFTTGECRKTSSGALALEKRRKIATDKTPNLIVIGMAIVCMIDFVVSSLQRSRYFHIVRLYWIFFQTELRTKFTATRKIRTFCVEVDATPDAG